VSGLVLGSGGVGRSLEGLGVFREGHVCPERSDGSVVFDFAGEDNEYIYWRLYQ
jgi:hypothetical protein